MAEWKKELSQARRTVQKAHLRTYVRHWTKRGPRLHDANIARRIRRFLHAPHQSACAAALLTWLSAAYRARDRCVDPKRAKIRSLSIPRSGFLKNFTNHIPPAPGSTHSLNPRNASAAVPNGRREIIRRCFAIQFMDVVINFNGRGPIVTVDISIYFNGQLPIELSCSRRGVCFIQSAWSVAAAMPLTAAHFMADLETLLNLRGGMRFPPYSRVG